MNHEFASSKYTAGQLNAMVKMLKEHGEDGPERFLRRELVVSEPVRRWREENGIIYFSVTSNGLTGEEWITRLESKKFDVGSYAKSVLRSKDFKPTKAGTVTEVAVLKGELFSDDNRTTGNIRAEADKRKFTKPNAEVACLIREKFTDKEIKEMGLWWIANMSDTINDSGGDPSLLGVDGDGGGRLLFTCYDSPDSGWFRELGFAFAVSQICTEG